MLSELRKKKMVHLFNLYDLNNDGFISLEDDFVRFLDVLVGAGYLESASEKYNRMRSESVALWNDLRDHADKNRDERVNLNEWLTWHNALDEKVEAGATFPFEQYFATMFSIMDMDGTGYVTPDEYQLLLKLYDVRIEDREAQEIFAALDRDDDGRLSREEVAEINANYWYSEDEDAPDNLLFGRFE